MIVLASASPRRQELLRNAGIPFVVQAAAIDESPLPNELPRLCAERLAREKARTIFRTRLDKAAVLGADTVVVVNDQILGKPADAADAVKMLNLLSGKQHQVITGVCLCGAGYEEVSSESTTVTMCALSEKEIAFYAATEEPVDKAGAYAIQGIASRWITRIEGDYANVVGLPVALVYRMLRNREIL